MCHWLNIKGFSKCVFCCCLIYLFCWNFSSLASRLHFVRVFISIRFSAGTLSRNTLPLLTFIFLMLFIRVLVLFTFPCIFLYIVYAFFYCMIVIFLTNCDSQFFVFLLINLLFAFFFFSCSRLRYTINIRCTTTRKVVTISLLHVLLLSL